MKKILTVLIAFGVIGILAFLWKGGMDGVRYTDENPNPYTEEGQAKIHTILQASSTPPRENDPELEKLHESLAPKGDILTPEEIEEMHRSLQGSN